jgi:hypothetical protein
MALTYIPPTDVDIANALDFARTLRGVLSDSADDRLEIEASRFTCFGSAAVRVINDLVAEGHHIVLTNPTALVRLVVEECGCGIVLEPAA